jgi:hypothetical protein
MILSSSFLIKRRTFWMEPRLEKRYNQLLSSHMQMGVDLVAGAKSILNKDAAFNQTQAA